MFKYFKELLLILKNIEFLLKEIREHNKKLSSCVYNADDRGGSKINTADYPSKGRYYYNDE